MPILSILLALILLGVLWWAIQTIAAAFSIDARIVTVIKVLLVVFVVLWIVNLFTPIGFVPRVELR